MKKFFKQHLLKNLSLKNKGAAIGMAMAMSVVLVSVASNLAYIALAESDFNQCQVAQDYIQEELLLRTESQRMQLWKENKEDFKVPDRVVEIKTSDRVSTYYLTYKESRSSSEGLLGFTTGNAFTIKCLATAKRGARYDQKASMSSAKRLTVRSLRNSSLAQYQYFTNIEKSENGDDVRFYGRDELFGPVHSNDDIYIRNLYGWPKFHGMVTCSGRIMDTTTGAPAVQSAPMDNIFLGGYEEEVGAIGYAPNADDVRARGLRPFDGADENDIVYVKMDGGSYSSKLGNVSVIGDSVFTVYDIYPDNANKGTALFWVGSPLKYITGTMPDTTHVTIRNYVTMKDTVWTDGASGRLVNGFSYFVPCKLWIEGKVSGKVTFGAADTVFITNDIYYANNEMGDAPDDMDNPNRSDCFGLVSEEQIHIKYKHHNPFEDGVKCAYNCGSARDIRNANGTAQFGEDNRNYPGIVLYGAYAAIGDGDPSLYGDKNSHYQGMFTFEYQHPHGSTPNFTGINPITNSPVTKTYIDLHKYIFTHDVAVPAQFQNFILHGNAPSGAPTCGYSYGRGGEGSVEGGRYHHFNNRNPNVCHPEFSNPDNILLYTKAPFGTDYPWYNPVWPEDKTYIEGERGKIYLFGAVAQTRRGFIHRSGSDPLNHPSNPTQWDMKNFQFSGTHMATGYNKEYHYDERLRYMQPPDFPQIYESFGNANLSSYEQEKWYYMVPSTW